MNYMQDNGLSVLANGYPLIPIVAQDKRPAIGEWRTIKATEEIVNSWSRRSFGIGIRTGLVVLLDLDIPNLAVDRVREVCIQTIGSAPIRIGNAPKMGLMYRAKTLFSTRISDAYKDQDDNRCAIEALADKRQFVAFGTHPVTRQPYRWINGFSPANIRVEELTLITQAQIEALFQAFYQIAFEEGWTALRVRPATASGGLPFGNNRNPVGLSDAEIATKMAQIPNDERFDAREDWLSILMAIHHETNGSEEGREIAWEWSAQHPSHAEDNFRKAWDSLGNRYQAANDNPITFRFVLKILKDQKTAERKAAIERLTAAIGTAADLEAIRTIAFEISTLEGLDEVSLALFAAQLQDATKRLGTKLTIGAIRKMLKPFVGDVEMPKWLADWVFLKETDQFYNTQTCEYVGPNPFNRAFGRYVKDIPASRFATDVARIPVHHMTAYLPGEGAVWVDPLERSWVNTYRDTSPGIPAFYSERDLAAIELVKAHANHLFGPGMEREIAILHSALAYIVQTGRRINWLLLIQGAEAVGKTFYAHLLRAVLGGDPHVYELTTDTLTENAFTSWAEGHQVVYIEELKLHGKRYDVLNKMKSYISNEYVSVHAKYRAPYNIKNATSYFAFTNHRDAIPIDQGDTRYFIMLSQWQDAEAVKQFKEDNPRYYDRLWQVLEDSPGALRRWLLEYDLHPEFSPVNRAPASAGREIVLRESKPELQQEIEDLIQDGQYPWISNDLVVVHLLREVLGDEIGMMPAADAVRNTLRRMQFTPVDAGRIGFGSRGQQKFFYCWSRNREIIRATSNQLRDIIGTAIALQL